MPNWKKVITSGSDAALNSLLVTNGITGSLLGTASTASFVTGSNVYGPYGSNSVISASYALTSSYAKNIIISGSINNVDYIDFNTGSAVPAWKSGRVYWDNTDGALAVYNAESDITLQVGQESWVRVFNEGTTITDGTAVRIIGSHGDMPLIVRAQSIPVSGSALGDNQIIGIATHTIETNSIGYVTTQGLVRGLNTNAFADGDLLFVSSSAGVLTNITPISPYEVIQVGVCVKAGPGGSGIIFVFPTQPIDFGDLSSAERGIYQYGDIWSYVPSGSVGVWKHGRQLSGSYGLTGSLNATSFTGSLLGTASYATQALSSSYALSASHATSTAAVAGTTNYVSKFTSGTTIGNSQIFDNGTNVGIGNTLPNEKLELSVGNGVAGGLRINYASTATSEGMDITYLNTGNTVTSFDSRYNSNNAVMQFRMKTAATAVTAMTILGSGNVGIGTTSPSYKLDVAADGISDGIRLSNGGVDRFILDGSGVLTWGSSSNAGILSWGTSEAYVYGNLGKSLSLGAGGSVDMLYISASSGYVGIGTTGPSYKLDVNGGSNSTVARFYSDSTTSNTVYIGDSGNSQYSELIYTSDAGNASVFRAGSGFSGYGGINSLNIYNDGGPISFSNNSIANMMYINTSGNVGIGTTSITSNLQVQSNNLSAPAFAVSKSFSGGGDGTAVMHAFGYDSGIGNTGIQVGVKGTGGFSATDAYPFRVFNGGTAILDAKSNNGIRFNSYGSGTYTGTTTYNLAVDSSGNVIESTPLINPVTGTGVDNRVAIWSGTTTQDSSANLTFDGTTLGLTGILQFPQNPVGTTYGNGVSASPPYAISQGAGDSDAIKFYAESAATNQVSMVFEVNDDIETAGSEWIWRNKKTYDTYAATTPMLLSGTGNLTTTGNATFGQGANRPVTYDSNGGNFRITANAGGWATGYLFNGSAGTYKGGFGGFGTSDSLTYFWIGDDYNAPTMILKPSQGYVGIGTTDPQSKLHVYTDADAWHARIGGASGELRIGGQTSSGAVIQAYTPGGSVRDLYLQRDGGSVGIGTTSLSRKLNVAGTIGSIYGSNQGTLWLGDVVQQEASFTSYGILDYTLHNGGGYSPIMRVQGNGRVGIGTTDPQTKLEVRGSQNNTIVPANGVAKFVGGDAGVFIGTLAGTPNYGSWIQAMRESDGLEFPLSLQPNAGSVGIGTTGPSAKLHIDAGALGTSANDVLYNSIHANSNSNGELLEIKSVRTSAGSDWTTAGKRIQMRIDSTYMGYIQFNGTGNQAGISFGTGTTTTGPGNVTERMIIDSSGNVGIGTGPATKLHVNGTVLTTSTLNSTAGSYTIDHPGVNTWKIGITDTNTSTLHIGNDTGGSFVNKALNITNGGNVGIGTTGPSTKLHVVKGSQSDTVSIANAAAYLVGSDVGLIVGQDNGGGGYGTWIQSTRADNIAYSLSINANGGNVAIGTLDPGSYKLNVNGNTNVIGTLTATVKSFIIDHPTKEGKKLQYGVLEGPEHSVYVRGKLTNTNVIQLPDHWHALVHEDSITVNLTAIGKPQEIWVEEITDTYITVGSLAENVNCFYTVFAERKDIDKLVTEFDKE